MATENETEILNDSFLGADYKAIFRSQWTPWVGGLLIGLVNVLMFAYAKPWGVADGVGNWGSWVLKAFTLPTGDLLSPLLYTTSITNLSLIAGAFISALFAREFVLRLSTRRDMIRGILGGILLGIGSVLGIGCTIGGFFSSYSALSLAGPLFMLGLIPGVYFGLKVLLWDLDKEAARPSTRPAKPAERSGINWSRYQPLMGLILLGVIVALLFQDDREFTSSGITGLRSILIFFGIVLGIINQRTRFCFVRAFREPFMTGDGSMTKGAAVALLVGVTGFAVIKGSELSDLRDLETMVNPSVWIGSISGGIIFGFGMVLSGGCASGSLWRLGEGQLKFVLVLTMFAVTNAAFSLYLRLSGFRQSWGEDAYFLPDYITWSGAVILLVGIPILWYLVAAWNEKTGKLVIK